MECADSGQIGLRLSSLQRCLGVPVVQLKERTIPTTVIVELEESNIFEIEINSGCVLQQYHFNFKDAAKRESYELSRAPPATR